MNDEKIVQNGATGAMEDTKRSATGASVGKIGRLPKNIREEFNRRIDDGQAASEILPWVNGLPATKKVLAKYFGGVPISDGNLSLWRRTGFNRWLEKQESIAELKMLAEDAKDFSKATGGNLARGAANIATAKIFKLLQAIPAEQGSIDELTKISYAVTALLNAEQSQVRLEYEKTRVFQGNERLVLSWDKFLRSRVETAQRVLDDTIAKDIQAADIDNGEKIELLGHHLFGKKWQGREVGKKEDKKEPEGNTREDDFRADQQVRPTTVQGHSTEVKERDAHVSTETMGAEPVEPQTSAVKNEEKGQEDPKRGGATAADQQVRPTTVQGHSTEVKETDATPEQHMNRHSLCELEGRAHACVPTENASNGKGREDKGGDFPIAATKEEERGATDKVDGRTIESDFRADQQVRPTNANLKSPAPELSPYEKAIREGQTPLAALYAQFAPDPNPKPKPPEDPSVPKPDPWDSFSEPVRVSPFAFRPEPLRPPPGLNTLG